jgi:hypothetical protein
MNRANENVEARILWRADKQKILQEYTSEMLVEARKRRSDGDYAGWKVVMDELLAFHEEQRPDLLVIQAARRLKQAEGEK